MRHETFYQVGAVWPMNKCDRRRFDDFAKDAALRFTAAFSFVSLDDSSTRRAAAYRCCCFNFSVPFLLFCITYANCQWYAAATITKHHGKRVGSSWLFYVCQQLRCDAARTMSLIAVLLQ